MNLWKLNDDGISCEMICHRPGEMEMPEGYSIVPIELENSKGLWLEGGVLTNVKPQTVKDADDEFVAAEMKIEEKMRKFAIGELKKDGELPSDFIDKKEKL